MVILILFIFLFLFQCYPNILHLLYFFYGPCPFRTSWNMSLHIFQCFDALNKFRFSRSLPTRFLFKKLTRKVTGWFLSPPLDFAIPCMCQIPQNFFRHYADKFKLYHLCFKYLVALFHFSLKLCCSHAPSVVFSALLYRTSVATTLFSIWRKVSSIHCRTERLILHSVSALFF